MEISNLSIWAFFFIGISLGTLNPCSWKNSWIGAVLIAVGLLVIEWVYSKKLKGGIS